MILLIQLVPCSFRILQPLNFKIVTITMRMIRSQLNTNSVSLDFELRWPIFGDQLSWNNSSSRSEENYSWGHGNDKFWIRIRCYIFQVCLLVSRWLRLLIEFYRIISKGFLFINALRKRWLTEKSIYKASSGFTWCPLSVVFQNGVFFSFCCSFS